MNYVLITGAYGGLGEALAREFYKQGFGLVLLGRKEEKLERLKQLFSETSVYTITCDVSDWKQCQSAYQEVMDAGISIKVLINNAGITYIKKLDENYDIVRYKQLIDTNLNGSVYMTKLLLNQLLENQGSVINISSVIGYAPVIGRTAYAASKFGMEGFFRVLQAELPEKLHIMMVYPTFIATQIREKTAGSQEVNEILTASYVAKQTYRGYQEKKKNVYLGKTAKLSRFMYKFFPKIYVNLMRKKVKDKVE
jgi:short-subunit dehydrogenase